MKILICGLPGSGKTWLAERLIQKIDNCAWFNADAVRKAANDWDFEMEGRIRQAMRMRTYADFEKDHGRTVICDFVAPTEETRAHFDPDYTIWLDTIPKGRFEDTNKMFEIPAMVDKKIDQFLPDSDIFAIASELNIIKKGKLNGLEKANSTNAG